ncbi:MAG TPA: glycosyltransferase [Anaerolineae bacterium]|nr:glycosyltransferase [Anaerolineae bacterium]
MEHSKKVKKVLVLLIGEVLEDPRVYKTCMSLLAFGTDVTVACTNPSLRPERETYKSLSIIRFPHPGEFFLKKLYIWLQSRLHPGMGQVLARSHEEVSSCSITSSIRNFVLNLNYSYFMKNNSNINKMMVEAFTGESFDLLHCNDIDTLFAGNELKRKGTAKALLYDSHEYWAGIGIHGRRSNEKLLEFEASGIWEADYVVTVNPIIADLLKEQYNLKKTPAVVMNCPYRYEGKVNIDSEYSPVRIVYQGKLQAFRGLAELVLAFKYIKNGMLTLSGYGPLEKNLKLLVKSEKLSDQVIFTGRYDPLEGLQLLTHQDIGVMPFRDVTLSIIYSSPNKLFDYAMAGLAVAANDLPFLSTIIRNNDIGKLFDRIDPEHISETLNSMISDSVQLIQYKKNARKVALQTFCWEEQFYKNYPWKP